MANQTLKHHKLHNHVHTCTVYMQYTVCATDVMVICWQCIHLDLFLVLEENLTPLMVAQNILYKNVLKTAAVNWLFVCITNITLKGGNILV